MTKVYLTIDTEYEFGFAAQNGIDGPAREQNFARSIQCRAPGGDVGIAYQMDVLERHGLKAVFFVDPMPALVWGTRAIARVVEPILARGHDVQLHVHTEWLALAGSANPLGGKTGRNIKDFTRGEQEVLLDYAREALMAAGAPRPVAFRAGNYGANDDTLRALARLGFAYSSNHTPGIAGSECDIDLGPEHRRPLRRLGVTEIPIGCIQVPGGLRHAQLTALSCRELRGAVNHACRHGIDSFTIVSHSFELMCRGRRRINRIVRRRFEQFCAVLEAMPGAETATYADGRVVARTAPRQPRQVLPPNPVRSGVRIVEQAVANALYGAG
ncbi:polysaccharide deacetylase family protein [Croceibacterium aestuarii]|uniref:polysaccharide deacetylase family protein n=1 Tax=Croceibacterium aestuarii TaxID=3064139 RepID=UPI00272E4D7D|nr:polysaccharide deacetylase family protein [Croceibacterium sp. D39]